MYKVLHCVALCCRLIDAQCAHTALVGQLVDAVLRGLRVAASTLSAVRREVQSAQQATTDAGASRWAKLLGVRQNVHR